MHALSSQLRQAVHYRKFVSEKQTVLVLESKYHLQNECAKQLEKLGHRVILLHFDSTKSASPLIASILQAIVQHKPDFILSINYLGFDSDGTLANLLEQLRMPIAIWFVDSPFFILRHSHLHANTVTSFFSWEQQYVSLLRLFGAQDVIYLPLAADSQFIEAHLSITSQQYKITFVGDSLQLGTTKWSQHLDAQAHLESKAYQAKLLQNRNTLYTYVENLIHAPRMHWDRLAYSTFAATQRYRYEILRKIGPTLRIFGDKGWAASLPDCFTQKAVAYGSALAGIYQNTAINLNITSIQMPSAVNQRTFDVPACGGFVLGDAQSDVGEHFDIGQHAITYTCADEAVDLANFYLKHPAKRIAIAQAARKHTLEHHTYQHRLKKLVAHMQHRHRPAWRQSKYPSTLPKESRL